MRLRTLAAALALPASTQAAEGRFSYRYYDVHGGVYVGELFSPAGGQCVTLPTAESLPSGDHPYNATDTTVVFFAGDKCTGDYVKLPPRPAVRSRPNCARC
ncbi:hypothetical protein [Streptomyces sp. NPDC048425]|uniref:hypothetical protein n=1 Tax=Streptomyces sp. NPDC048425 TaxID=3365548 RepID=UPI003724A144